MTLPFFGLAIHHAWSTGTKDGSLFDFDLVEKDMVLYISIADDFFDPVHDGFIADSFHTFSSLR